LRVALPFAALYVVHPRLVPLRHGVLLDAASDRLAEALNGPGPNVARSLRAVASDATLFNE
jgi:hypothetical protein